MHDSGKRLGLLLGRDFYLAHRYARAATNRALRAHRLDLRHIGVLGHLAEAGPAPQRTLVDELQMDKSSMVYVIDELERQGLVHRRRDLQDRRRHAVHITDEGRTRLQEANETAAEVMKGLLAPLSERDQERLHDLLAAFIANAASQG
ncbi:MAG TPA: MarR family transcriptional regulator [Amycolatopsis sp.]|nr:MarR family transcriptional regulator [Amycolatopsis sp.]